MLCDFRCCPTLNGLLVPIHLLFTGRPPSSPLCPGPAGVRSSYASQHSQLGQDLRSAISPDRHIAPIYEDRTFQGPLYRSPSHNQQGTLYRSSSGWHHHICVMNLDHKVLFLGCHHFEAHINYKFVALEIEMSKRTIILFIARVCF